MDMASSQTQNQSYKVTLGNRKSHMFKFWVRGKKIWASALLHSKNTGTDLEARPGAPTFPPQSNFFLCHSTCKICAYVLLRSHLEQILLYIVMQLQKVD